jgi:L-fucose isomerase-like protein
MVTSRFNGRPRIAIVLPVTLDWQAVVPFDLGDDRKRLLELTTRLLADEAIAETTSIVESLADADHAAERARDANVEATLVVMTMAVRPAAALAAIRGIARPVVVWALQQGGALAGDVGHAEIVANGGTVGAPILTSLLTRDGHPFELVLGPPDAATLERISRALRAAAAAHRISTARLGRVGLPVSGYGSVDLSEPRLRDGLGVSVIRIDPAELLEIYEATPAGRAIAVADEMRSLFAVDPALNAEDLARAARGAAALEELVARYELDAGALTCHVQGMRFLPGLGFAPCFALGRMSSRGVPWSCSSDLPAAVAMVTLSALGAAAQYHELEMLDCASGEFLVASSGEHDLRLAGPARPRLVRNGWFPSDPHAGVCACFGLKPGPATLLAFAQIDAPAPTHRFVVASGEFGEREFAHTGTPHAAFRFAGADPADSWERWCHGGASLHSACSDGDLTDLVGTVGRHLGVEVERV